DCEECGTKPAEAVRGEMSRHRCPFDPVASLAHTISGKSEAIIALRAGLECDRINAGWRISRQLLHVWEFPPTFAPGRSERVGRRRQPRSGGLLAILLQPALDQGDGLVEHVRVHAFLRSDGFDQQV